MNQEYYCRVCGLYQNGNLREPDASGDLIEYSSNGTSQFFLYAICACCGTEFGIEDIALEQVRQRRSFWISSGAEWFLKRMKPASWSIEEQLENIPDAWR